jgi:4'-phosphopantetheinyl transferase
MSFVFQPLFSDANPAPGQFGAWIWKSADTNAIDAALSAEEVARVSAMAVEPKRNELARSLGERRHLLAMLLGCAAADLRIAHDNNGKPYLPHYPETKLSLSDSNGWNALALSEIRPVGIDIECLRPLVWEPMLAMLSVPGEAEQIKRASGEAAPPSTFFRCWTAKEAILKAAGTGLKGGAKRVVLPSDYIAGQCNRFTLSHDGATYQVELAELEQAICACAIKT